MTVVAAALAALAMSGMPVAPVMPDVRHEACPSAPTQSCTGPGAPIFLNPNTDADPSFARYALLHEMGHQFSYQVLGDDARLKFLQLTDDTRAWRAWPNSPNERFAEAYALCALRARGAVAHGRVWGAYGYELPLRRHRRICLMIRRVGAT